jgi:hypothetical protein
VGDTQAESVRLKSAFHNYNLSFLCVFAPLRELSSLLSKNKSHAKSQRRKEGIKRYAAHEGFFTFMSRAVASISFSLPLFRFPF